MVTEIYETHIQIFVIPPLRGVCDNDVRMLNYAKKNVLEKKNNRLK